MGGSLTGRQAGVGSEIRAICGRCGDVWHVVVALADDRIAQVECGECRARHRYRPTAGSAAAEPRRAAERRRASGSRRSGARAVVEADPSRPPRCFSPRESYQVGDRLLHPTFGEGVVQATLGIHKVEVRFGVGTKVLVQGRGER